MSNGNAIEVKSFNSSYKYHKQKVFDVAIKFGKITINLLYLNLLINLWWQEVCSFSYKYKVIGGK